MKINSFSFIDNAEIDVQILINLMATSFKRRAALQYLRSYYSNPKFESLKEKIM